MHGDSVRICIKTLPLQEGRASGDLDSRLNLPLIEDEGSLLAEVSHDEAKCNERRELCRLLSSFLSRMRSRFLNNQWRFCQVRRTGLNLSTSASGCWIWARAQILNGPIRVEDETTLRAAIVADPILWGKPKRRIWRRNFSFFTSLSTAEAHVFGVKFIGLYGTVGFIAIRDFSFRGESGLWSDVWSAMDGVVSLLEGLSRRGKN